MRGAYLIRTPENVTFQFELAGIASRAVAWAIDIVVFVVVLIVANVVISTLTPVAGGFASAVFYVIAFVMQWFFTSVLEWWWGGRTVGKYLVGIRTLTTRGVKMSFLQSMIRNIVRIVDLLPGIYLAGGLSALIDRNGARLGDLAAGTIVVRERRAAPPSVVVPASERYNSFVDDPSIALAARRITAPERDAMVGLSLRREQLPLPVRRELFARLADHLEERLGVPRPPFFSEEKYVLNLTAVALGLGQR